MYEVLVKLPVKLSVPSTFYKGSVDNEFRAYIRYYFLHVSVLVIVFQKLSPTLTFLLILSYNLSSISSLAISPVLLSIFIYVCVVLIAFGQD